MATGQFNGVKLLLLIDRATPRYITGISDLTLRGRHTQTNEGGNFLLQFLKTFLFRGGPLPGGILFYKVRGADEWVKLCMCLQ